MHPSNEASLNPQCHTHRPIHTHLPMHTLRPDITDNQEDLFFKSQASLADTCQEESPRNRSFLKDMSDQDCFSLDSLGPNQTPSEGSVCSDFFLQGCCMRGQNCERLHIDEGQGREVQHRRLCLRVWEQVPQLSLLGSRRAHSFLN